MTQRTDNLILTDQVSDLPQQNHYLLDEALSILYCRAGSATIVTDTKTMQIEAHDLAILSDGTFIRKCTYSDDLEFYLMRIKNQIVDEIYLECFRIEPMWWEKHTFTRSNPVMHMGAHEQNLLEAYYQVLSTNLQQEETVYSPQIRHALARAVAMEMLSVIDRMMGEEKDRTNVVQSDYLFRQFIDLMQEHSHQREVQWYAERIGITPKYLSEICKQRSGKSASEWIAEITMSEIKIMLRTTSLSIKEIAYQMGFPNSSFFCQYVKKHSGMTPNKLRKEQANR